MRSLDPSPRPPSKHVTPFCVATNYPFIRRNRDDPQKAVSEAGELTNSGHSIERRNALGLDNSDVISEGTKLPWDSRNVRRLFFDASKATTDPPFSTSALILYTERPSLFPSSTVSTTYPSSSLAVTAHMANKITSELPQHHYKIVIKVYPHNLLAIKPHSCVSTDGTSAAGTPLTSILRDSRHSKLDDQ
jgi:hypothetical protein